MNLKEFVASAHEAATKTLTEHPDIEAEPTWQFLREDGKVELAFTPWSNDREKLTYISFLTDMLEERDDIIAYVHTSEAWMAKVEAKPGETSEQAEKRLSSMRVSQRPNRQEVLISIGADRHGKVLHMTTVIGAGRQLGEPTLLESENVSGNLVLPIKRVGRA